MAESPKSLTIRMYNVGFGDCFLLTFAYSSANRYVLVDFGSTSAPKKGPKNYMQRIADDIKKECGGKLHALVATHRHRDHISGFSTDAGTGKVIASLNPDHVIQPWTEDPKAKTTALTATSSIYAKGKPDATKLTAHFLASLEDMHRVAGVALQLSANPNVAGEETRAQLQFLGEDNLTNLSAVKNLMAMGKKAKAYYVSAEMKLNILPGVQTTVLGPPTLKQSNAIRKERSKDPSEFWQFRSFWASQRLAMTGTNGRAAAMRRANGHLRASSTPPNVRWFLRQTRQLHGDQLLELVRDLDTVMNNTSVILLFEIGKHKLLFPGDAQIENWAFALNNRKWTQLLADVNLYKVGHHGSLNATPKSLWALFKNKDKSKQKELKTLCSTKAGKHGSVKSGTEVPRRILADELGKHSDFDSTENFRPDELCREYTIVF